MTNNTATNPQFKKGDLLTKTCFDAEFKLMSLNDNDPNGYFEGYASVFGNYDHHNEAVVKGAYADCLDRFIKEGFVANSHDWNSQHAMIMDAKEDEHGLWVKGMFHSDPESQVLRKRIQERMAAGKSVKMSIGYRVLDAEPTQKGRLLKKLDLFEVSFVTVPANDLAHVTGIKSQDYERKISDTEEFVDELGDVKNIDSLLAGTTFARHSEIVLSATQSYVKRADEILGLRLKEGRVLSRANLERLTMLRGYMTSVLDNLNDVIARATGDPNCLDNAMEEMAEEMAEDPKEEATETAEDEVMEEAAENMMGAEKGLDGQENKADELTQETETVQEEATANSTEVEAGEKSGLTEGDLAWLDFIQSELLANDIKLDED